MFDRMSKLEVLDIKEQPLRRVEILDAEEQFWTLHFEGPKAKVQNSFKSGLYDISKVWKSFIGRLLSGRSGPSYFEGLEL
ncbi:hypothetical protein RclHR1_37310001 [Rhizophagus clarus]|uniref:Uncharacterized protein n=1 Tax=Rhizophagus clarus TaxID=94130 RepID=A0A2Z6RPB9_9GLOM|nr:hypothetical protein RclHR1_37310001 [Rhizophagus clarus]